MSQEEKFGTRDGIYSAWHRRRSTARFVGIEEAQRLGMIDVDFSAWVEYDEDDKEPLVLIETARDVGQERKPSTVIQRLAMRCKGTMPAYTVLYKPSALPNPAAPEWNDIEYFRVKRIWPNPENSWKNCSPEEWAQQLLKIRTHSASLIDEMNAEDKSVPIPTAARPSCVICESSASIVWHCPKCNKHWDGNQTGECPICGACGIILWKEKQGAASAPIRRNGVPSTPRCF